MSEEDVRLGLRDAVDGEPPLDFDPDALVTSARHQVKRRRALLAVGVATVAVVAAAVAVPIALGRGETQVAEPPASTATSEKPTQWSPTATQPSHLTEGDLRHRGQEMAVHLKAVVPDALPTASEFEYGEFGGEASGQFYEGQTSVNAAISFTVDHARYSIVVTVWVPGGLATSPGGVCAASGAYCKQFGERDGGPIVVKTEDLGDQTISTMYHFRPSGGVVQIAAYNYDMASRTVPKYMPAIPVTLDQMSRLATDPDLGL
jgi:hypothetical protein